MPQYVARALPDYFGYIAGNWYLPLGIGGTVGGTAMGTGFVKLIPFIIPEMVVIDAIGAKVNAAGTTTMAFALFNSSVFTLQPSTLIDNTPPVANTAIGMISGLLTRPRRLESGLYWFGAQANDTTVNCMTVNGGSTPNYSTLVGDPLQSNLSTGTAGSNVTICVAVPQTYGAWADLSFTPPSVTPGGITASAAPFIHILAVG